MSTSARIVSGHAPRRAHFGVRVRSRSTNAPPTASTHAITSTVVIDGPTWLSRKRPSSFASTRNETRPARFSDESADSIFRPSIDFGRSSPYRCRIVGATSTMLTKPSLRVVVERKSPRPNPGARTDDRRERRAFRGRRRSHHDDRVALRVDVVEQPADELVGVAQRVGPQALALLVGREAAGQVGPHEIGPLHQHDRPIGPRLAEGIEHLVGIEADAERRAAVGLQQVAVDPPSRHLSRRGS